MPRAAALPSVVLSLAAALLIAGCASFPELDAAISPEARQAGYPTLVPVGGVLARRDAARIAPETEAALLARAANLRARARLLRGVVVEEETRLRLAARLRRLGG